MNTYSADLEASSSQYFSISDASQTGLDLNSDFTIEAWIKIEQLPSSSDRMAIFTKFNANSTTNRSYFLRLQSDDKLRIGIADTGGETEVQTDSAFVVSGDVGNWVHLAACFDISASTATFYKNGLAVAGTTQNSQVTSIRNSGTEVNVGRELNGSGRWYFDGLIDNIRVWSDIRTQEEIVDNAGALTLADTTNLVGWWKFNNDATDESANGNDLTANNSPVYSTDVPFTGTPTLQSTDVILWYDVDEGTGSSLTDNATNYDASFIGGPTWSTSSSITNLDSFLSFDGSGDGFSIGDVNEVDGASAFTYAGWFKFDDFTNNTLWGKNDIGSSIRQGAYISGSDSAIWFYPSNSNNRAQLSTNILSTGTWYHMVFVYNGSGSGNAGKIQIYVNGFQQPLTFNGTVESTSVSNSETLYFGLRNGGTVSGWDFTGDVAQFQIFNQALTSSEALELFNGGDGTTYSGLFGAAATFTPKVMWL